MTQPIRRIGNSQGIILPRPLLQQVGIDDEVSIEVIDGTIILRAVKPHPRSGWEAQFQKAEAAGHVPERDLFDGLTNDFDQQEWTW